MENKLQEILQAARLGAPYHTETKEELIKILKDNGGEYFQQIGDLVFTTNKDGILKGMGFNIFGDFKIWKNTNFGTFKVN